MTEIANTSWYRTGSVSTTAGSNIITGTNTIWTAAGINPGATFRVETDLTAYEVLAVNSDTEIELRTPYKGTTASGRAYSIDRNHQSTPLANLVADVASVMHKYEAYIDADMQTVTGKSAYEIAVQNGYVGTESEWLHSLEGAQAWSELDARTKMLDPAGISQPHYANAALHNSHVRFKNLGSAFTAEQAQAISSGTFDDLWLGDYWRFNNINWFIAGFDHFWCGASKANPDVPDMIDGKEVWRQKHHVVLYATNIHTAALTLERYNKQSFYWRPGQALTEYRESEWCNCTAPLLLEGLAAVFGEEHLMYWKDVSYTCDTNGVYTGYTDYAARCELPTCIQMLGYTPKLQGDNQTMQVYSGQQFPLMRRCPQLLGAIGLHTLRDLVGNGRYNYATDGTCNGRVSMEKERNDWHSAVVAVC